MIVPGRTGLAPAALAPVARVPAVPAMTAPLRVVLAQAVPARGVPAYDRPSGPGRTGSRAIRFQSPRRWARASLTTSSGVPRAGGARPSSKPGKSYGAGSRSKPGGSSRPGGGFKGKALQRRQALWWRARWDGSAAKSAFCLQAVVPWARRPDFRKQSLALL